MATASRLPTNVGIRPPVSPMAAPAFVVVAWGALAFGAVYPWAYWPLLCGGAAVGLAGWLGALALPLDRRLLVRLATVAAAIAFQIVPMPAAVLTWLSPSAHPFLENADPAFLAGRLAGVAVALRLDAAEAARVRALHPLSVDPLDTAVVLACFVALALFFTGMARVLGRADRQRLTVLVTVLGALLAFAGLAQKALGADLIYGL